MPPRARSAVRLARCGLLALLPLLGGCAAAVLAPAVLAGGAISQAGNRGAQQGAEAPIPASPEAVPTAVAGDLVVLRGALPPPSGPGAGVTDPWRPFVDYALERGRAIGGSDPLESALLAAEPALDEPDRRPCVAREPAVLLDLDPGSAAVRPGAAAPAAGLAEALARLREAGLVVMWISQADANRVTEIGEALRRSGLDPTGRDPLLLVRSPGERKQVMRAEANKSVCILAIAGDRRGDFDELFDYLRNPDSAAGLDAMLGSGWFLTPSPLTMSAPADEGLEDGVEGI